MKKELTELDRLALAARAEVSESSLYRYGWLLGFLAVISVPLALTSEASPNETLAVRMFAALTALSAVTIWLRWRYSLHAAAIVFFALAVGELVFNLDHYSNSFLDWTARAAMAAIFANGAFRFLKSGAPFAAVHSRGWEEERAQVKQWLATLTNLGTEEQVFEISTGNFWKGYFTYRFMRCDQLWVIVRFKKGNYLRPLEYRVLEMAAFKITPLPDGTFYVQIDKRKIREAVVPLHMRESLLRAIGTS